MSTNHWIIDRNYGSGIALGFRGDKDFIARSVNFAFNYVLPPNAQVREFTPNFSSVNTTMEKLVAGLTLEGIVLKKRELVRTFIRAREDARNAEDDAKTQEQLEAEYNELKPKVDAYLHAHVYGDDSVPCPVDDTIPNEAEMDAEAELAGPLYAEAEMAKIIFDDYMTKYRSSAVVFHTMSDGEAS